MPRVILVQVVYNHRRFIPQVFSAVRAQTFRDLKMVAVIAGSQDGSKNYITEHYPEVEIIDPGYNIGFAKGHNLVFAKYDCDFFQLVNPDLIMTPAYVEELVKVFDEQKDGLKDGVKAGTRIGAAAGKLLFYNFDDNRPTEKIDSTGVVIYQSGRARDRGQHEEDHGQYDADLNVMAVSGAGAMYRKSALEEIKYRRLDGTLEYFDEDFHSYWEDVDLSWRMIHADYACRYAPFAVAFHGRGAGSSEAGYKKVAAFIEHHKTISPAVRQLNYKNHIFMYLKNSPKPHWKFFAREFFMLGYIILFEIGTLKVIPELFRQLPAMWQKRKYIQKHIKTTIATFP